MSPEVLRRSWDLPQIRKDQPLASIKIARTSVQLQTALRRRHGGQVVVSVLCLDPADPLAGAVEALRPRIRRRYLKPPSEPTIHAGLQLMVSGIALAGPYR